MSKIGNWIVEMQENASDMTLPEFIKQYGSTQASIWHEVQQQMDSFEQDYFVEMDDGA